MSAGRSRSVRRVLRDRTRELHDQVEAVVDVPATLRTPADVDDWMMAWHRFLSAVAPVWADLGAPLDDPTPRVAADLVERGHTPDTGSVTSPAPAGPDAAAGVAYVVAGSALGTDSLAPSIAAVDPRPARFLDHDRAGRDLRAVSAWLDAAVTDADRAVDGAVWAFGEAEKHLSADRRGR